MNHGCVRQQTLSIDILEDIQLRHGFVFALVSGSAAPVFVLALDLVDGNVQRVVGPRAHGQGLVDAKLCRCHRLTLWEGFEVKAELLPVRTWLKQAPLMLLWKDRKKSLNYLKAP